MTDLRAQILLCEKFERECGRIAESPLLDEKSRNHWRGHQATMKAAVRSLEQISDGVLVEKKRAK